MRGVRVVALALAAALMATACGEERAASDRPIRVGLAEDEYVLEGPTANVGAGLNITETLISLTPEYQLEGSLAERWEFRPPNTWRFFLRRGVTFHDGQPLNAAAVKVGLFDRVAGFGGSTIYAAPESAVIIDDFTIDFTPTQPNRRVPQQIVHPYYGVLAPGSDAGRKPIGTGPFRFVEHVPDSHLVIERHEGYWGSLARASRITFRFYPDSEVRRLALEAGDVDVATHLRPSDAKELEGKDLRVVTGPVGSYDALYANIHKPDGALSDRRVRQAVARALDRNVIIEQVLEGMATTDATVVPPALLRPDDSLVRGHPHDPERAAVLLDEAGWKRSTGGVREKDGRPLRLILVSGAPSADTFGPLPQLLQSQLQSVGVSVEILQRPDLASYLEVIATGEGDLYLERGSQNDGDPAFLPSALFYSRAEAEEADYPALFAPGERFDALIEPSLTDENPARVRRAVAEAMRMIVDEEAVVLPLAGIFGIYGRRPAITGFTAHPAAIHLEWATVGQNQS